MSTQERHQIQQSKSSVKSVSMEKRTCIKKMKCQSEDVRNVRGKKSIRTMLIAKHVR